MTYFNDSNIFFFQGRISINDWNLSVISSSQDIQENSLKSLLVCFKQKDQCHKQDTFLVNRHVCQTAHLNAKLRLLTCKGSQTLNAQDTQSTCLGGQDNINKDSPYSYFTAWELQLQESTDKAEFQSETNVISSSFFS